MILFSGQFNVLDPVCINGTENLIERGFEVDHVWIWYDQIGLFCLTLFFLGLTYFNLRMVKKTK